jgi:Na+ channel auxiliary subunit TipE
MDGETELVPPTLKEKLLFYTTAFFVLLAIFSLFAFLFLVPFVIEPALETIFHDFDENPAFCVTVNSLDLKSITNCSTWSSCREGCTKDVFQCTQIYVSYKLPGWEDHLPPPTGGRSDVAALVSDTGERFERAIREYDYDDSAMGLLKDDGGISDTDSFMEYPEVKKGLQEGNDSEFFYTFAELRPNIKGCGYPPFLNCTIWTKKYKEIGTNFTCYYARADPMKVITDLDMWQNTLNLVYSTAIPIPSFIISVIYLAFAYFKIYNEDEENAPLDKNAEDIDVEGGDEDECGGVGGEANPITENGGIDCHSGDDDDDVGELMVDEDGNTILVKAQLPNGTTTASITNGSKPMTPTSDLNSFGHQLKVKMADEQSRDSLIDGGMLSTSGSLQG